MSACFDLSLFNNFNENSATGLLLFKLFDIIQYCELNCLEKYWLIFAEKMSVY